MGFEKALKVAQAIGLANPNAAVTLTSGGAILDVTGGVFGYGMALGSGVSVGSSPYCTSTDEANGICLPTGTTGSSFGGTGGSSGQQRGAALPAGYLITVTLSEAGLRGGVYLPSSHEGLLQVTTASVFPVEGFKHDVVPAHSFKDKFGRALTAAYRAAKDPRAPVTVAYDVSVDDPESGYNGILKKATIHLAFLH